MWRNPVKSYLSRRMFTSFHRHSKATPWKMNRLWWLRWVVRKWVFDRNYWHLFPLALFIHVTYSMQSKRWSIERNAISYTENNELKHQSNVLFGLSCIIYISCCVFRQPSLLTYSFIIVSPTALIHSVNFNAIQVIYSSSAVHSHRTS